MTNPETPKEPEEASSLIGAEINSNPTDESLRFREPSFSIEAILTRFNRLNTEDKLESSGGIVIERIDDSSLDASSLEGVGLQYIYQPLDRGGNNLMWLHTHQNVLKLPDFYGAVADALVIMRSDAVQRLGIGEDSQPERLFLSYGEYQLKSTRPHIDNDGRPMATYMYAIGGMPKTYSGEVDSHGYRLSGDGIIELIEGAIASDGLTEDPPYEDGSIVLIDGSSVHQALEIPADKDSQGRLFLRADFILE